MGGVSRRGGWVVGVPWVLAIAAMPASCSNKSGPPGGGGASFDGGDGATFGDGESDATVDAPMEAAADSGTEAAAGDSGSLDSSPTDAATEADAAPACNPAAPFGTPTLASYPVDPTATDYSARLSVDLRTMYLMRAPSGLPFSIFTATRASSTASFGALSPLAGVAFGTANMQKPTVTGDQLTLYLDSDVPPDDAGTGGTHVWAFTRTSIAGTFVSAGEVNLGAPSSDDLCPYVTADGQTLYFSSDRAGGISPYIATMGAGGVWNAPVLITELDSPGAITFDLAPSADGLTMYFGSNRSGDAGVNAGGLDVWVSRRASTSAPWGAPVHVDELATAGNDEPSWTSPDGCTLMLSSSGAFGDASGGSQAIYQATRP